MGKHKLTPWRLISDLEEVNETIEASDFELPTLIEEDADTEDEE